MTFSCCGPCFKGLRTSPRRRQGSGERITTMQEALRVGRSGEGTWTPSPKASPMNSPPIWSSPAPRRKHRPNDLPPMGDMEFVMKDFDEENVMMQVHEPSPRQVARFAVEQLLSSPSSLPEPFATHRREEAMRLCGPTPTGDMLARVPRRFLEEAGEESQALRRRLVRGATVVFVSAGYPGKRFVFERAAELGIKSVIIDHPDSWSRGLVEAGLVAKFMPVDMSQTSDEVYKQAESLIRTLGTDGLTGPVDGIVTFVELSVPLASRLCEAFGLPGSRPESVDAARDKHRTRAVMKAAGLPTPRNMLIRNESELKEAAAHVKFPAVLKPISGAASLGVRKVESEDEFLSCYHKVVSELRSLVVSSGALQLDDGTGGIDAMKVVDLSVLLEQYLDGKEVDIDIVFSDGEWQFASITDNGPTMEPYFPETWALCPSLLSKDQQTALKELAVDSVKALGFTTGVFHVELKYTSTGPHIIEVNPRMGGGPVWEVNRRVWGVDLVEEACFCSLGIPSRPFVPAVPITCIGYYFVNARRSGRVRNLDIIEKIRGHDGVVLSESFLKPGDTVVGAADGMPSWLCQIVVSKSTPKKALNCVLELESLVQAEITWEDE
eukprot:TRINITY_DN14306_c1_g1_i2.p1 TRINITY_DN14306_c1_g1~~TRINITY_DN14306_c1_g1_i2.p1  ORF type:complete len:608 (+),score=93.10 TRINITY_DN14306_c1_g1_i2:64-1887(+)